LDKCYIGSSPSADVKSVFRGQLGAVYLFTDALSWPVIQAIYHLGPGYKVLFQDKQSKYGNLVWGKTRKSRMV
jgi:hypothetical protein